jgi:hypothetical protein
MSIIDARSVQCLITTTDKYGRAVGGSGYVDPKKED